jgi:hypothetical protein
VSRLGFRLRRHKANSHYLQLIALPVRSQPFGQYRLLGLISPSLGPTSIGIRGIRPFFCSISPLFGLFGPSFGPSHPLIGCLEQIHQAHNFGQMFVGTFGRMFSLTFGRTFARTHLSFGRDQYEGAALITWLRPPSEPACTHAHCIRREPKPFARLLPGQPFLWHRLNQFCSGEVRPNVRANVRVMELGSLYCAAGLQGMPAPSQGQIRGRTSSRDAYFGPEEQTGGRSNDSVSGIWPLDSEWYHAGRM